MTSRKRRIVLIGVAGLVGLVALAVALLVVVDPNAHKARLEAVASRSLGLEVAIAGAVTVHIVPRLQLVLHDVLVRGRGADVVSAKTATIDAGLMYLLGRELRIDRIVLKQAVIAIEQDREGRFNFQHQASAGTPPQARDWPELDLSESTITYADARFGQRFEARDCRVAVRGLQHAGDDRTSVLAGLSFTAELGCVAARRGDVAVSDLQVAAEAKQGVIDLKSITAHVIGAQGSGSVRADFSGPVPAYRFAYAVPQFPIEALLQSMGLKVVATGRMDLSVNLTAQGRAVKELQKSLTGTVSLRGKGLTFNGGDLDQEFARFESSQTFNLVDVGAVFLAGPLGLLVTKGYDFASLSQGANGSSEIRTFVSDWKIDRGVVRADDVAMATKANRVAMQGAIDWPNERFDDVTIAMIDSKGCVKVQQKIRGSLQEPVVEKPGLLQTLSGPAMRLLKKGTDLLAGQSCEVFYTGSVAAPS